MSSPRHHPNPGWTDPGWASGPALQRIAAMTAFLEHGGDVMIRDQGNRGWTIGHYAMNLRSLPLLRRYLEAGGNPMARAWNFQGTAADGKSIMGVMHPYQGSDASFYDLLTCWHAGGGILHEPSLIDGDGYLSVAAQALTYGCLRSLQYAMEHGSDPVARNLIAEDLNRHQHTRGAISSDDEIPFINTVRTMIYTASFGSEFQGTIPPSQARFWKAIVPHADISRDSKPFLGAWLATAKIAAPDEVLAIQDRVVAYASVLACQGDDQTLMDVMKAYDSY